ncbi:PspC domain-containing protein [Massilia jejuensis]|uniref:PspC domain-containing protein n=1 Tax=Massilia jejuensis TaxID=648894 RepID=A0ABW0PPT8_9BURK
MISDEIRRLHELHQAGALTLDEFERAKAKVLAGAPAGERINLDKDGGPTGNGGGVRPRPGVSNFGALRRSRADRWLGGVCGGLAGTLGMDAWVWRLVFAVFTILTSGFGALVYLLLWIFVPEE